MKNIPQVCQPRGDTGNAIPVTMNTFRAHILDSKRHFLPKGNRTFGKKTESKYRKSKSFPEHTVMA